jgi:hypothetical protein
MDISWSLPKTDLYRRLEPVAKMMQSRQSGSFVGLPESAKSSYLKFFLDNQGFAKELIPDYGNTYLGLYYEPLLFVKDKPNGWLYQLAYAIEQLPWGYTMPVTERAEIIFISIKEWLEKLYVEKKHLTIFIGKPYLWHNETKETGEIWKTLWDTHRQPPHNPLSLIFLFHSMDPLRDKLHDFYKPLMIPLSEQVAYFPALNEKETMYTLDRFMTMFEMPMLTNALKCRMYEVTGGYYPLLTQSVKLWRAYGIPENNRQIDECYFQDRIQNYLFLLWKSLPAIEQQYIVGGNSQLLSRLGIEYGRLSKDNWIHKYVIEKRYEIVDGISSFSGLSNGELQIWQALQAKTPGFISREEVAQILWQDEWTERYSEWAIDKVMSRLRKKIATKHMPGILVTVKGKGYRVVV